MATGFVLICVVIVVGFLLEVAVGGGVRTEIHPPPDRPRPDGPLNR